MSARLSTRLARATGAALFLLAGWIAPVHAAEPIAVTSPGGITAWLVSDDTVPLIAVDFAFRGGASQDPADRPGVANLLSTMLDEGAGELDSAAFQRRLEDEAVRIGFDASRDSFSGSLGTLSSRREAAFDLLALALQKPRFDAAPLDRMKAQLAARLKAAESDPETIASRLFNEATFPDHPYGRPVEGTLDSLAGIGRDDLVAFHKATFARDNLVIGVVGDITAQELAPLLDKAFAPLPETATLTAVPDVVPAFGKSLTAQLPVPQTTIRIALPGPRRLDPDFMAAFVVDHILGGGDFSSRLYLEVREKRGLAYSVWSSIAPLQKAGLFLAGTATSADRADETLAIMRAEIARLAAEGPTQKELDDAKRFLTGNYALRFDSSSKISAQLVGLQLVGLPISYFADRNALVAAVSLDDVRKAAAAYLAGPPTVVTVGPAPATP